MARQHLHPLLVHLLWLLAAALQSSSDSNSVSLKLRGWPPIHCNLSTHHAASSDSQSDNSNVDFWMRGAFSRQLYRCRLDAEDEVRERYFPAHVDGYLRLTGRWTINLNRFRGGNWPENYQEMNATETPRLSCVFDTARAPSSLPGSLFPLVARHNIESTDVQWHKCILVPEEYNKFATGRFFMDDSFITLLFRGGAPTIVCRPRYMVSTASLPLRNIIPLPYACSFATYLDFPLLSYPSMLQVFQKMVVDKWATNFSRTGDVMFPPFQCWPAADGSSRLFHFDLLFDGNHAHRCLFQGHCPLCSEDKTSSAPPTLDSSRDDGVVLMTQSAEQTTYLNSILESLA